jgi:hypothetical protein
MFFQTLGKYSHTHCMRQAYSKLANKIIDRLQLTGSNTELARFQGATRNTPTAKRQWNPSLFHLISSSTCFLSVLIWTL